MPDFTFTSPSGQKYTVKGPEGATAEQAFGILQTQMVDQAAQARDTTSAQPPPGKIKSPEPMGGAESFMTGLADPVIGAKQLYSHVAGTPQEAAKTDLAVKTREQEIERRGGGGVTRGLGAATTGAPLLAAGPAGIAGAAVGGAIAGAAQPTVTPPGGDYWSQKGEDALYGAAFGAGTAGAGKVVGSIIGPALRPEAKAMVESGVKLTPGQMIGGIARRAEEAFKSLPILGSFIRGAEGRGIEGFNRAVLNQSLETIGQKLDPKTAPGRDAIAETGKKLSNAYDALLPNLQLRLDQDLTNDIANIRFQAQSDLTPQARQQFEGILNNRLAAFFQQSPMLRPGPLMTQGVTRQGPTLKETESALRYIADNYRSSGDSGQRLMAVRLDDVRGAMRDALIRQNPQNADLLRKIDQGYALFTRAQGASVRRTGSGGIFTPNDLLATIKGQDKTARKGAFARGDALLQDFAEYGQAVLPAKMPDSGTTERALYDTLLLAAAGAAEQGVVRPEFAIGLAGGAAPYTRPGIAALNALAQPGPTRAAAGAMIRGASPYAGIAAVPTEKRTFQGPME